ncbi:amidohydrolase family protein [Chryseomicrobium palamuruense]|uniref:Amidohydrolase family protein n=1 Tax=Chryseomicrobium palamuruense TaxID=682973 RepID=A0ABV8UTQ2_9BACL
MGVLITNGTIIDVETGNTYLAAIEIEGTRIKRMIHGDEPLPNGLETLDAEGKFIIPGLIDMHCHIHDRYAPHFVASGVTTVRNTAGNVMLLHDLIHAADDAQTPRIYASDRMIDGLPGQWGETSYGNFVTDDPEEARREVRRQAAVGAKFVKLYGWITQDVMEAAIDEAKHHGLEVAIDLINSKDVTALDAIKAGVTWIEHVSGMAQEIYPGWSPLVDQEPWSFIDWYNHDQDKINALCQEMLARDVKLCPTMVLFDQAMKFPDIWSPQNKVVESVEKMDSFMQEWKRNVAYLDTIKERTAVVGGLTKQMAKTYHDMGGTVVAGTDTPALLFTYPGMALHRELEIFVEIGLSELEALQAATIRAARSIGLDHIGILDEGKMADLVILKGNPLEDINWTREIEAIVKGGRVFNQEVILACAPGETEVNARMQEFMEKWDSVESR